MDSLVKIFSKFQYFVVIIKWIGNEANVKKCNTKGSCKYRDRIKCIVLREEAIQHKNESSLKELCSV